MLLFYDYCTLSSTLALCHGRNETHVWLNLVKPDVWLKLDRKYIKLYKIYKFVKLSNSYCHVNKYYTTRQKMFEWLLLMVSYLIQFV